MAAPPGVVAVIGPLVAFAGRVAWICVLERTTKDAAAPLKRTEVVPVNPVPVMVTVVEALPLPGEKLEIVEGCVARVSPRLRGAIVIPLAEPATVIELVPVGAVAVVLRVRVDVVPVVGLGLKLATVPLGAPLRLNVTELLELLRLRAMV